MAQTLTQLYGNGNLIGGITSLVAVKDNCPFEYYTNDPEFVSDAKNCTVFVAQRLGVGGTGASGINITELTMYAAFEEAVTTYGNMVYQYRIRDQYLNFEGAQTLPFNQTETADKIVLSQDLSINSTVFWSDSRTATWGEIEFDLPNSSSAAGGEIYVMSSSLNDYLAPDVKKVKNWNMFYYQDSDPAQGVPTDYDWSQTTYPQFNKIAGPTIATTNYSSSFTVFNTNDLAIFTSTPGSSSFSVTGSNGNKALFIVTASVTPSDSLDTFYITTGSNANETANNIANKFNSVSSNFGLIVTANTGSTPVQLDLTSSIGVINPVGSGFEINWLDNLNNPAQTTFTSAPNTYLTYQITEGESWVYFFTGYKKQDYFPNNTPYFIINTAYYQDILLNRGLNGKLINNSLQTQVRIAESYAQEAGVGGSVSEYTGSIDLQPYQQMYDLNAWAKASASLDPGDKIEVRQVFYQEPPAIVRYFDPYAGTGTGVQGLLETFGFGSYSPGVNFMLMPVYWDIQKIQAIEFNDQVRKSAYSFDLVNNQLRIFPVPTDTSPARLFFKYMKVGEKYKPFTDNRDNVIADVMRVPYRNPIYADINQVGRSWIFRFTLALCKEIEGQLRASISSAIANVVTINGVELLTDSRTEKTELLAELKEYLEQTTRRSQLERRQQESDFTRQTMNQVPLLIYAF